MAEQRAPNKRKKHQENNTKTYNKKMTNIKDKKSLLKAATEIKKITYKSNPIRLSTDFLVEILKDRRQ